ncbi:MAG TPA: HAD family hydrolase, partial [Acidimicrobiales bacterium]|nr:HAD family hydrolase [Acidimicrobiales bacterium]
AGECRPMAAIHRLIGMGSDHLLDSLVGEQRQDISEAHGRYYRALHDQIRALPGAAELVCRVKAAGGRVVLASSAQPRDLDAMLGALGAGDAIDHVVSSGDVGSSKPAPDIFAKALEACQVHPTRAVVVGDTVWDVRAASQAGIGAVAVQTGGQARQELEQAGALAVYADCSEILERWPVTPLASVLEEN